MTTTWIQRAFSPVKRFTPPFVWNPIRSLITGVFTPLRFSYASGHFLSSLRRRAVDRWGRAIPWYTYPAIDFLARRSFYTKDVLEFGGGQSTLWWASRAANVLVIEEDASWATRIAQTTAQINVRVCHAPLESGLDPVREFIGSSTFDVVVIDGHARAALVSLGLAHLRPGGAVIIDNSDSYEIQEALQGHDCQRIDFFGYAPGVVLPHCTSLVFVDRCFLLSNEHAIPKPAFD